MRDGPSTAEAATSPESPGKGLETPPDDGTQIAAAHAAAALLTGAPTPPPAPRGGPVRYKRTLIRDALKAANGSAWAAAQLIKCSPMTIKRALVKWPDLRQVQEDAKDRAVTISENVVHTLANDAWRKISERKTRKAAGLEPEPITALELKAATFILKTLGRKDYGAKLEMSGPGGGPIPIVTLNLTPEDAERLSQDARLRLLDEDPAALEALATVAQSANDTTAAAPFDDGAPDDTAEAELDEPADEDDEDED